MKQLVNVFIFLASTLFYAQVGGRCEGCKAVHEYGNKVLNSVDTLPKFQTSEPKLKLYGTVFKQDGKTPANNVILYIYHTNREGVYETTGNEKGWGKKHGFIRGWVKTDVDGNYTFYTFRPASYPNSRAPQHIHMMIKEPKINEYYIDDIMFTDDKFLTTSFKNRLGKKGGSGVVTPKLKNKMLVIKRDIILGKNIPNYPN